MSYTLKPWQRLLVLLKQITFKEMPDDLTEEVLRLTLGNEDDPEAWARGDLDEEVIDLVQRIESRTGKSSDFDGIIIDGPTWSTAPEVPTGEPGWSSIPPAP